MSVPRSDIPSYSVFDHSEGVMVTPNNLPQGVDSTHTVFAVGDFTVPITKEYAEVGFVFIIAAVVVFVILLVGFAFYSQKDETRITDIRPYNLKGIERDPLIPNIDTRHGATGESKHFNLVDGRYFTNAISCNNSNRGTWSAVKGRCECNDKYWGDKCHRSTHNDKYYAIGSVTGENISSLGTHQNVSHISDCLDICDNNSHCNGVLYENNVCELFSNIEGNSITFDPNSDGNLYVSKFDVVYITNRVFLGYEIYRENGQSSEINTLEDVESSGFSMRYHIDKKHAIPINSLRQLHKYPTIAINRGNLTGVYSTHPFKELDYNTVINSSEDSESYYIHFPGEELKVPKSWYHKSIWVMYKNLL